MARDDAPPQSHSLIEIPAREFTNQPSSPPPARLAKRTDAERSVATDDEWKRRLQEAAAQRNAALNAMRHRCREHVQHVTNVVQGVKEMRRLDSVARHAEMQRSLVEAEQRRRQHMRRRAEEVAELSARRSRLLRSASRQEYGSNLMQRVATAHDPLLQPRPQRTGKRRMQCQHWCGERLLEEKIRAARKILLFYLLCKARRALTEAGALGPQLVSYSFAQVTACLEKEDTQKAADAVFRLLGLRKLNRQKNLVRERTERRILLSCLVVALHPDSVLEQKMHGNNSPEMNSIDSTARFAARRMLLCLQAGTVNAIASAWVMWRRVFLEWKKNDARNLLDAMIEDAVAMEALRTAVGRKVSEAKQAHDISSCLGVDKTILDATQREHTVWEEQISEKQEKLREAIVRFAGASGVKKLDAAIVASHHIQDEHLIHEILIDLPQLQKSILNGPPERDADWVRLREELSSDSHEHLELTLRLGKIAKVLNGMIADSFSLADLDVPTGLNVGLAVGVVTRAGAALKRCQAEIYDDALEEWVNTSITRLMSSDTEFVDVVVTVLRELSELVGKTQAAVVAYKIESSVPVVRQYGVAWARSHFEGHIVSGKFCESLPRTLQLLRETLENIGGDSEGLACTIRSGSAKGMRELLTHALVQLSFKQEARSQHELAEILYLDVVRIRNVQNEVQKLAFLAALDNIGRQFVREKGAVSVNVDIQNLAPIVDQDENVLEHVQDKFVSLIQDTLQQCGTEMSSSDTLLVRAMVEGCAQSGNRTMGLMQRRLEKGVLEKALHRSARVESGNGLDGVRSGIERVSKGINNAVNHLTAVHGARLLSICKSL